MNSIENVELFKILKKKDEQFASKVLETSNLIEALINKKTTINFPNYTNHDINHSINIMNTMYELIQANIDDFNQLELALMIYAGLFHDIGMSLDDNEISKIKDNTSKYLYKQSFEQIKKNSANEVLALQEVIRTQHGKIANDLVVNRYSEYFILVNTSISFAKDLGLICQSHTEGENFVSSLETDSLKGEYSYNSQFIAILLRVADILDIDSTRTPLELYKSMDLNEYSNEEWLKNFTIDNTKKIFEKNDLKIVRLDGEVKEIKVHRKLLNYIEWIENELKLAVEKTADMQEKYRLHINIKVQNNIKPIGYTVPDLKLNMDYKAVTNLLMGESVYGSKSLGLRELIQNSIDACMVKKEKLQSDYKPTIEIYILKDKNQIIVKDNGMGMNENIIKKYFLNVGKSYYKSTDFLNYEHSYNPIGNFGIGFLSCFMLSSHVKVVTKYHGEKYKYSIDLEQNSEYISFTKNEDYEIESGTQIILQYDSVIQAMGFKEDGFEKLLSKFITDNILIEEFEIKINNNSIEQNKEIKKSEFIIDVNQYAKNLFGIINLHKAVYYVSNIESQFDDSYAILYFDGDKIIKLDNLQELVLDIIVQNNNLLYCKIPLLEYSTNKKYHILKNASYLDESDAINSLNDDIKEYIYLFSHKNFSFEEGYGGVSSTDYDLYLYFENKKNESEGIHTGISINEVRKKANIDKKFYTPLFIVKNVGLLYKDYSSVMFFDNNNYMTNTELYIKNIKINGRPNKLKRASFIGVLEQRINIKDNNIIPDLARKNLTSDSNTLLEYAIYKVIHEYALENFDLTSNEKVLLKKFIDTYYGEDSILLTN
ncbi:MAG TPA: hypothetical protein CFH83_06665 [Sulfuricurvum kujiense]|uniref:HD-CE domain-containing protein n=1 Tax=Sulfuricurvum kujiense TaxID=148813 RepID=A0A2D3WAF4_9BACT|nr:MULTISPECIES: ATP-binding protein [Sulfuricurvum]OHD92730.1 MAG: hypothetical protein A2517_03385 [Sulfuricurvum sp. RIFOXYD12_FULL_44_77]DAB38301.1 MAG TPA: hypothetical protein CFH83_06665 [Sulfuricurvum kujiense]